MTTGAEGLFAVPTSEEQQWRLDSLLLCNWGGFDGIHEICLSVSSTLLSGVSGSGKSTVLDAWTTLVTPNVALNAASNEAGARARGDGTRTTLTYVRGQYGVMERGDFEVPLVLRGTSRPGPYDVDPQDTWSVLSASFLSTTGLRYTFLRTFFAPREAVNPGDMKTQYAVLTGKLDAEQVLAFLEPAARDSEFSKTALERLPGLTVLTSTNYHDELQRRLGIGAHGAGDKALRLLADLQRGKPVSRVSRLFQELVLERPMTFDKAEKVVASFDGLDRMHAQMKEAEDQLSVLDGLDGDHREMTESIAEIADLDILGVAGPGRSRFQFWAHQYKARLYGDELSFTHEQLQEAAGLLAERNREVEGHERLVLRLHAEYLGAGGGDVDSVEAELGRLAERRDRVVQNRRSFAEGTKILGLEVPEDVEGLARAHQEAHWFLAGYGDAQQAVRQRSEKLQRAKWRLTDEIDANEREIDRLRGATGNIDGQLTAVRDRFADAAGLAVGDLPFVGELVDMHADWEEWRAAADAELGGFANTVLLDDRLQDRFRRAIDDLPGLRRRVRFRAVTLNLPVDPPAAGSTLAGRLVVKDGPFAGWLRRQVNSAYDLLCVETAAHLGDGDRPRITRTGQTRRGSRGAHGSGGRVIGFSNVARQAELRAQVERWQRDLEPIDAQLTTLDEEGHLLADRRSAHQHVSRTQWSDLDLSGVDREIRELEAIRDRLIGDRNLEISRRRFDTAVNARKDAAERQTLQRLALESLETRRDALQEQAGRLAAVLEEWSTDATAVPTRAQIDDLDTRLGQLVDTTWEDGPDGFDDATKMLRLVLQKDLGVAASRRDAAAARITTRFREYQAHPEWHSSSRSDTLADYEDYLAILTDLRDRGLHAQRRHWARAVIEWSGEDLSELVQSYRRAQDDIDERLRPIRAILASIAFGREGHRLDIEAAHRSPAPVAAFLQELRALAAGSMNPNATDDAVVAKFTAIRAVVARIRGGDERNSLLDIRRHLTVKARARDLVYDHLGELSGGEGQMITAFIVGAALRYHLGDEKRNRPRFAPVVLDEAFIKADGEYTASAVEAWNRLGFQLIVGAPEEKVNSLEAALDLSIVVTKNPEHYSYAQPIPRKPVP